MKTLTLLFFLAMGSAHAADEPAGLRGIMQDLGHQVQKGADAIAREDWPALTLIARKLAEHPAPPATEKVRILTALGNDAARFRELDHQTHHAANEMGEAAKKADGRLVIEAYAKVQSACLACHQGFRSRVRQAIDAPFVKKR